MKRFFTLCLSALAILAAACSGPNDQGMEVSGAPVDAAFSLEPAEPVAGQPITFSVKVTQEGQPVDDAKEVSFEWWKDGQEQHQTIPAKLVSAGVYTAQQTISEPGSYFVYYHVTARDFHNMRKMSFTVKAADNAASASAPSAGHAASGIDFHLLPPDELKAQSEAVMLVHLMKEQQPFAGGTVRFEFWTGDEAKHSFADATEPSPGQYAGRLSFPAPGEYTVKVHLEKGDVHDHQNFTVTVQ
ncbi:FixH family protein [Brevibacillus sp. SAFN-007a]|uniref:FixH family protein n=1 Tax=Brevibacillus sp. SAFN-007a TaxID=3436862 RepID=UPI003F7E501D